MKTLLTLIVLFPFIAVGQTTFSYGVISTTGAISKADGTISVSDSTVVFKYMGVEEAKEIINTSGQSIYVTYGTAMDKITITPTAGKIKGFTFDHTIVVDKDSRFTGGQFIYYCRRH